MIWTLQNSLSILFFMDIWVLFSLWLLWLNFLWLFFYFFSLGVCHRIDLPNHRLGTCLFLLIANIARFPVWFYQFTFPPTVDINFVILTNVIYLCDFIYIYWWLIVLNTLSYAHWPLDNLLYEAFIQIFCPPFEFVLFFLLMICRHST